MARPDLELTYSVLLPGRMILSQSDVDFQIAHAGDFNCEGLNTFTIVSMVVVTMAVMLRLWSRKIERIEWRSDDYTLIAGLVRSTVLHHRRNISSLHKDCLGNPTNQILYCVDPVARSTSLFPKSHIQWRLLSPHIH